MQILVGIKQILDPEISASDFKVDPATNKPVPGKAKLVMDSYSEYALEVALQFKEKNPGTKIAAVCVGDKPADEVLRRALALQVDEAIRVWDSNWDELDAHALAQILGKVAARIGGADLVLVGRQSGDVERGLVGPMLAEELKAACITVANRVEASGDNKVTVRREADGGFLKVESRLPAVVAITNDDSNVLRLPKVKDIMMASRKPITALGAADLGLHAAALAPRLQLRSLFVPQLTGQCELVAGESGSDQAAGLTKRLRELKVV